MSSNKQPAKSAVPALDQAVKLLMQLANQAAGTRLTLTEICKLTGMHPSRGHTLLNVLRQYELVHKDEHTKTYGLGLGVLYLASNFLGQMDIKALATPSLENLAAKTNCTAHLGLISNGRFFFVVSCESESYTGFTISQTNRNLSFGAHGKAIYAFGGETMRTMLLNGDRQFYGLKAPVDLDLLTEEAARARSVGYAVDNGQITPGISVISAPVFNPDGSILGCVNLIGAYPAENIPEYGELTKEAAGNIARLLSEYSSGQDMV